MTEEKPEKQIQNVCDLKYLTEMMNGKKHLILDVIDTFLKQTPEELNSINTAVAETAYASIQKVAHTMKSSVSIMGISLLAPILQEMEDLGIAAVNIEKIKELNQKLNSICKQAIEEIEREKLNYI